MSIQDFDSSEYYAEKMRKKIQSVKKQKEEKEQCIADVTSAFQCLSSTVKDFYREAELDVLIGYKENTLDYELEKKQFDNETLIICQLTTMTFSCDYVSVIFAPKHKKITSGFASPKNTLISFVLEAEQDGQMKQDHTGMKSADSYTPSPDEQYTLRYSKEEGWSVNIVLRGSISSKSEIKKIDEKLTAESFLRIMSSFFSPVIK
ncbi:TPA: hypothetical protein ACKPZM_004575 [Serratia marcescens]|nr:hypothetical protein [Serratia marcescens]